MDANKIIRERKMDLIKWLRVDPENILQWVHCRQLITDKDYHSLKSISEPDNKNSGLLDILLGRGQEECRKFLELLKESSVNEEYPDLKKWIMTINIQAAPAQETGPRKPEIPDNIDYLGFLERNRKHLIQKVKTIKEILDDLHGLSGETVANIKAETTPQDKMRKLLEYTTTKKAAENLFKALQEHEADVMEELN